MEKSDSKRYLDTMFAVSDALRDLGESSTAVACKLGRLGIKGMQQRCSECPLTMYLRARGFSEAKVHAYHVEIPISGMANASFRMPEAVMRFVESFDQGYFKDLINGEKNQ